MTFVALTRSSMAQVLVGLMRQVEDAGAVGDAVRHTGDARDVLLIVGAGAGDQLAASPEHAVQRALERSHDRRAVGRPHRMDDHQVAQLVAEAPARRAATIVEHVDDLGLRRVEALLEQEAAIEHRAAGIGDARRLDAVTGWPPSIPLMFNVACRAPAGITGTAVVRAASRGCSSRRIRVEHAAPCGRSR